MLNFGAAGMHGWSVSYFDKLLLKKHLLMDLRCMDIFCIFCTSNLYDVVNNRATDDRPRIICPRDDTLPHFLIRVYSWKCGADGCYRQMWQVSCRRQGMLTQGPAPDPKYKV